MNTIGGVRAALGRNQPLEEPTVKVNETDAGKNDPRAERAERRDAAEVSLLSSPSGNKTQTESIRSDAPASRRTSVEFDVEEVKEDGKTISFRIVDTRSGEVIREYPAGELPEQFAKSGGNRSTARVRELVNLII